LAFYLNYIAMEYLVYLLTFEAGRNFLYTLFSCFSNSSENLKWGIGNAGIKSVSSGVKVGYDMEISGQLYLGGGDSGAIG
jgi:hypothetical protein